MHALKILSATTIISLGTVVAPSVASADPTSGVDSALFRSSYDTGGLFALEGARLMPVHDISFKVLAGYGRAPLEANVPGIGDGGKDSLLNYVATIDMAFGMTLSKRLALGIDVGGYRTATGLGYGARGRYGFGGTITKPSTGAIALRPLSNIDQSADPNDPNAYLGDGLAGPLDARIGLKLELYRGPRAALTFVGSAFVPFGDEQMMMGDRNFVFEPKVAFDWHPDRVSATRIVANVAMRLRERTVLQSFDTVMSTADQAKAYLDIGSEIVAGAGAAYELNPRVLAAIEAQVFVPMTAASIGSCQLYDGRACSALTDADWVGGKKVNGDFTSLVTGGLMLHISNDVTADLAIGAGLGGARADDFRVTTGLVWSPQPVGQAVTSHRDRDGDGIPDSQDACPDEPEDKDGFEDEDGCPDLDNDGDGIPDVDDKCPNEAEDKDGFQDSDGCPEPDNDNDGIPDTVDKCPDQPEDKDGFEDEDGCPDDDNDGDGIPDAQDKCPNDPETVNGFEDEDGCPDVRNATGPEERADRIDLKGAQISFTKGTSTLTAPAKQVLQQLAALIKTKKLSIRIEVHVALGTTAKAPAQVAAQKKKDKTLAQQRAKTVLDFLVQNGVAAVQLQAVGIGSERPLGTAVPTDPINDRVDFIKSQQGGTP